MRLTREDNTIIELPKIDNKFPLSYTCQSVKLQKRGAVVISKAPTSTLRRRNLKTEVSENASDVAVNTTPEEFHDAIITGHFRFVFELNSVKEITWLSWWHSFWKAPFSKCFPSTRKRKADVKFLRFEERFRKAAFSWRISLDGRPNRRNKAAFSNSYGVVLKNVPVWETKE